MLKQFRCCWIDANDRLNSNCKTRPKCALHSKHVLPLIYGIVKGTLYGYLITRSNLSNPTNTSYMGYLCRYWDAGSQDRIIQKRLARTRLNNECYCTSSRSLGRLCAVGDEQIRK